MTNNSMYFSDVKSYLGNLIERKSSYIGYNIGDSKRFIKDKLNRMFLLIVLTNILVNLVFFLLIVNL